MTDPERLVNGADDFERALLNCAATDEPPTALTARTVAAATAALSLSAAPAITSAASAGASKLLPGAVSGVTASQVVPAKTLGFAAIGKWLAIGVVAGAVVSSVAAPILDSRSRNAADNPVAGAAPPVASASVFVDREVVSRSPTAVEAELAPAVPAAPNVPPRTVKSAPQNDPPAAPPPAISVVAPADTLEQELAAIADIRRSVGTGDGSEALRKLARYQTSFPHGRLSEEAAVLRIEAHVAMGQLEQARSLARSFLASTPRSPHARRVRSLTGVE